MTTTGRRRPPSSHLTALDRWVLGIELALAVVGVAFVVGAELFDPFASGFEYAVPSVLLLPTSMGLLASGWPVPGLGDLLADVPALSGIPPRALMWVALVVFAALSVVGNWLLVVLVRGGAAAVVRRSRGTGLRGARTGA